MDLSITNLSSNLFKQIKLISCKVIEEELCSHKLYTSENTSIWSHLRLRGPLLSHFADFIQFKNEHIPTKTTLEGTTKQCLELSGFRVLFCGDTKWGHRQILLMQKSSDFKSGLKGDWGLPSHCHCKGPSWL